MHLGKFLSSSAYVLRTITILVVEIRQFSVKVLFLEVTTRNASLFVFNVGVTARSDYELVVRLWRTMSETARRSATSTSSLSCLPSSQTSAIWTRILRWRTGDSCSVIVTECWSRGALFSRSVTTNVRFSGTHGTYCWNSSRRWTRN